MSKRKKCRQRLCGGLRCTLKRGHKYGHVYESSETRDRHAPD